MRLAPATVALALALAPIRALAAPPAAEVDIDEQLGAEVPADAVFTDQDGHTAPLGAFLDRQRPTLLVLAYYRCPMLCGLVLRGVVEGINALGFTLGADYQAVTVSIDPRDTPEAARAKRKSALGALDRGADLDRGFPFLVGGAPEIARLAGAVGFRYAYDARTDQYAHPAAVMVLTPAGRVSRYLYGVSPSARDLRLALTEAGEGRTGTLVDRVILTCYRYDPASRAYGPTILGIVRLAGALVLFVVAGTLGLLFRREARRKAEEARAR